MKQAVPASRTSAGRADPAPSRLNDILRAICAVLLVLCAIQVVYSFARMPLFYRRAVTQTLPDIQIPGLNQVSNARTAQEAAIRGLSIPDYVRNRIARDVIYSLGFYIVSFLILRRARGQWFLWFTALVLFFIPSGQLYHYLPLDRDFTRYLEVLSLLWPAFPLFLYLFPNGSAVPGWMRWFIGPILVAHLFGQGLAALAVITRGQINVLPAFTPYLPIILGSFPLVLIAQVYRYLRVSTREERAQTKWVVGGLAVVVLSDVIFSALFHMDDAQSDYGFSSDISNMLILLIPITIGISILRYRLYDIDVIIRRAVFYGLLTAILSLVYLGSVIVLQQVFVTVSGQASQVAIVISTLVIAALFTPLRSRLQREINRRFFRSQYNAGFVLDRFSQNLRHEVDLVSIKDELAKVVHETIQPEQMSLWIRKMEK